MKLLDEDHLKRTLSNLDPKSFEGRTPRHGDAAVSGLPPVDQAVERCRIKVRAMREIVPMELQFPFCGSVVAKDCKHVLSVDEMLDDICRSEAYSKVHHVGMQLRASRDARLSRFGVGGCSPSLERSSGRQQSRAKEVVDAEPEGEVGTDEAPLSRIPSTRRNSRRRSSSAPIDEGSSHSLDAPDITRGDGDDRRVAMAEGLSAEDPTCKTSPIPGEDEGAASHVDITCSAASITNDLSSLVGSPMADLHSRVHESGDSMPFWLQGGAPRVVPSIREQRKKEAAAERAAEAELGRKQKQRDRKVSSRSNNNNGVYVPSPVGRRL
jgi:hypothetical protein